MDDQKPNDSFSGEPPMPGKASAPGGAGDADDYFFNADGFVVLTAKYLLERGYCCGNGCLHCPYDYKMVPEPRRTKLLENRKQQNDDGS